MRGVAVAIVCWLCLFIRTEAFPDYFPRGEPCPGDSECRPVRHCPEAVRAVTSGGPRPRRCGFRGFDELVCCDEEGSAEQQPTHTATRPTATQQQQQQQQQQRPQRTPATGPTQRPAPTGSPGSSPSAQACQRYRSEMRNELSNNVIDFKIIGGSEADEGEFPYMVAIGYVAPRRTNLTWNCGGSLISERYVLTAAHCITDTRAQNLRPVALRIGELILERGPRRQTDYGVEEVVLHPGHEPQLRYNDLALLRTDRAVTPGSSSSGPRPVCLPPASARPEVQPGAMLLAAGWGATDASGFGESPELRKVRLQAMEAEECARRLDSQSALPRGLDAGMLCASGRSGEDTCRGDSGGPLVVRANGEDTLVGVTSFGGNPCGSRRPGVYARPASALAWIESVVWP